MINRFSIKNFKALRDVTLDLTPMHVLIGPNDTGKTSILQALYAYCQSTASEDAEVLFPGAWTGSQLIWSGTDWREVSLAAEITSLEKRLSYRVGVFFTGTGRSISKQHESVRLRDENAGKEQGGGNRDENRLMGIVRDAIGRVHYCRWAPRSLALPCAPDSSRRFRLDPSGFGLASLLDDILGSDRALFATLEQAFQAFFPQIRSIKLITEPGFRAVSEPGASMPVLKAAEGKGVHFDLVGTKQPLPASLASDGMLLVLAYLAITHIPEPPRLILVEEPENGVHPKRLNEVLGLLRRAVGDGARAQILMTTHSPYVLDCFKPEEVTLCRRTEQGDIAVKRLSESKRIREQLDMFTLGEIWTSEGDEAIAKE